MTKILIVTLVASALGWAGAPAVRAQDEPPASTPEQLDVIDKGTDTIDVSKYPKEQQENYKVFSEKCSKCHTIARPINSSYALPEEWTAYVNKMRHKKRSGIDEESQKTITSFLIYDSSVRKKDLIEKKLKEKAAADKKDAPKTDEKAK